jgi:hypothetical protein
MIAQNVTPDAGAIVDHDRGCAVFISLSIEELEGRSKWEVRQSGHSEQTNTIHLTLIPPEGQQGNRSDGKYSVWYYCSGRRSFAMNEFSVHARTVV